MARPWHDMILQDLAKILQELGEFFKRSWQDFDELAGLLEASWRDLAGSCKSLEIFLKDHGMILARSWQDLGKVMARSCKNPARTCRV